MRPLSFSFCAIFCCCCIQAQADDLLERWLERQAELKSWSADLLQTRKLKTLSKPLENPGRVWFQRENLFRWQLGYPVKTIAIRSDDDLMIVYPKLRQVEKYSLGQVSNPMWQQVPVLLQIGFPYSRETFFQNYEIITMTIRDDATRFGLKPKSEDLGKLLSRVYVEIDRELTLMATELVFLDESVIRNVFSSHQYDLPLDNTLFKFDQKGYTVIDQN